MDNLTLGVIRACKSGDVKKRIVDFLCEYTGNEPEMYSDRIITDILRGCFLDYLKTADKPYFAVWNYFDAIKSENNFKEVCPSLAKEKEYWLDESSRGIISAFQLAQVRDDNGSYVNGFRD